MHTRSLRRALVAFSASIGLVVAGGCLSRPVVPGEPTTKTNFTTTVSEQAVDKIDLLFSIDNSASMGDKQSYLEAAIPDLINALVTPSCVDVNGNVTGASQPDGTCATPGSNPLFPPVHNMHIGIVSSSLGPRLGDQTSKGSAYGVCLSTATVTLTENGAPVPVADNNDDQAHLLQRASASPADTTVAACTGGNCPAFPTTAALTDAPEGFLDWFPAVAANTGKDAGVGAPQIASSTQLIADFADTIAGVQQFGCGIESQLENWYRFLIQPDPYATLGLTANQSAQWVGVDTTILQERRDFLRPDSLVAIIVLTDENDSEIDVRSIGGQGYYFMSDGFNPPRGTSACNTNPADPNCISCANGSASSSDPNCALGAYTSPEDWGMDANLRHVHMKAKYGLDPQYPLTRYVTGLTSTVVPDRNGEYPSGASSYVGNNNCTNPLFAATLPNPTALSATAATETTLGPDENVLCKLPQGSRAPNLVFYTIIGGVPHQLLQDPTTGATKTTLSASDWISIIGTDPLNYNYTGIDPHMIESYAPRTAQPDGGAYPFTTAALLPSIPNPAGVEAAETPLQAPTSANGSDPWNGREWITNVGTHADLNVDREYACIFPLTTPRDCTDPNNKLACDCSTLPGVLTPGETSPVCDATTVTQQDYAKAYPTTRELILANKLGNQGIVASICPIDVTDNAAGDDPNYGYRPAVATIIDRLKNALTNQCLPQTLTVDPTTNDVPCLILVQLPPGQNSCNVPGLSTPDPQVLASFQQQAEQNFQQNGGTDAGLVDPATLTVCQANEIPEAAGTGQTCKSNTTDSGWCYVTGTAAGTCQQAILFTTGFPPSGSKISLQCIESSSAIGGDGG